jgi:hypothetical protein
MNLEKANLKIMVVNNLGADIEDRVEGETRAAYELNGASQALRQAAVKVPRDLSAKVDASLKEGEIADGLDAMSVAGLVKKYLLKVENFLNHLADVENQKAVTQMGRVDGLRQAMQIIQKTKETEAKKIQVFAEAQERGDGDEDSENRTVGSLVRKERGSAADRKAAAQSGGNGQASGNVDPPEATPTEDRQAAEQAARKEHGSVAERRAAAKSTPKKKKATIKKKKLRAVKRAAPE